MAVPMNTTFLLVAPFYSGFLGPSLSQGLGFVDVVHCTSWTHLHNIVFGVSEALDGGETRTFPVTQGGMLEMADAIGCLDKLYEMLGDDSYGIWLDNRAKPYGSMLKRMSEARDRLERKHSTCKGRCYGYDVEECGTGCFFLSKRLVDDMRELMAMSFFQSSWETFFNPTVPAFIAANDFPASKGYLLDLLWHPKTAPGVAPTFGTHSERVFDAGEEENIVFDDDWDYLYDLDFSERGETGVDDELWDDFDYSERWS